MNKEDFMNSMTYISDEEIEFFYSAIKCGEDLRVREIKNKNKRGKKND